MISKKLYIFDSRIATHITFWALYYLFFSFIWASNKDYLASFFLEFVLLPIRIMAVYFTIYYLLPNFLLQKKYYRFFMGYAIMMTIAAILQRIFIHLFYENLLFDGSEEGLFSVKMLIRASVLINTTVFLVLSLKIFQLFLMEREKNNNISSRYIEIKADRRIHRINLDDILFVEGKGNYTTYNLSDHKKITAYGSIKKTMEILPSNFVRVHKSFVVNKNKIKSFDANTIQIEEALIPRGKSVKDEILFPR